MIPRKWVTVQELRSLFPVVYDRPAVRYPVFIDIPTEEIPPDVAQPDADEAEEHEDE